MPFLQAFCVVRCPEGGQLSEGTENFKYDNEDFSQDRDEDDEELIIKETGS